MLRLDRTDGVRKSLNQMAGNTSKVVILLLRLEALGTAAVDPKVASTISLECEFPWIAVLEIVMDADRLFTSESG